jgi:hypothetical protein
VTRGVNEKMAQNVAQPIFSKFMHTYLKWKDSSQNIWAISAIKKKYPKKTIT